MKVNENEMKIPMAVAEAISERVDGQDRIMGSDRTVLICPAAAAAAAAVSASSNHIICCALEVLSVKRKIEATGKYNLFPELLSRQKARCFNERAFRELSPMRILAASLLHMKRSVVL